MSATIAYYGGIVTDGLAICLDAEKRDSYPGTGTVWKSIVRNNTRSGSLQNGTQFDASSGSFAFDGVDDTVSITGYIVADNNFTVNLWCVPKNTVSVPTEANTGATGTSGQRYVLSPVNAGSSLVSGMGISVGTNCVNVYEHSTNYMPALLVYSATISSTVFTNICVVYLNKQPNLYINGTLVRTGLTSLRNTVRLAIQNVGSGQYGFFSGNVSRFDAYNRSLSAAEVLQNYNATKGRFGL